MANPNPPHRGVALRTMALKAAEHPLPLTGHVFTPTRDQLFELVDAGLRIKGRENSQPLSKFLAPDSAKITDGRSHVDLAVQNGLIEGRAYSANETSVRTVKRHFDTGPAGAKLAVEWAAQMMGSMGMVDVDATLGAMSAASPSIRGEDLRTIALEAATLLSPERVFAPMTGELSKLDEAELLIRTISGGRDPISEYTSPTSAFVTDGHHHVELFARGAMVEGRAYSNGDPAGVVVCSFESTQEGAAQGAEWFAQTLGSIGLVDIASTERAAHYIEHHELLG